MVGTPALRKYFCAMISVATCDQPLGMRMLLISKTTEPSGFRITEERVSQAAASVASWPRTTNRLAIESPFAFSFMSMFLWFSVPGMVSRVNQTSISSMCQARDGEMKRVVQHRGREHIKVPGKPVKFSTEEKKGSVFVDVDFVFETHRDRAR